MANKNYSNALTHAGVFHSDDVFSAAFLGMVFPGIEIERKPFVPEGYEGLVFDIGLGEFDHHQPDNEFRPDGTPYASFGKLWRAFATMICTEYVARKVDCNLVRLIDRADNGVERDGLATAISAFNPDWDSTETADEAFRRAVAFAEPILKREIQRAEACERAKDEVESSLEKMRNGIVILDRYAPWADTVRRNEEAKFVVYPSLRGGYSIQTVPSETPRVGRIPFPSEWLGNPDRTLGMTFCHPGNFIASTETLEQAVAVAKIAIAKAS